MAVEGIWMNENVVMCITLGHCIWAHPILVFILFHLPYCQDPVVAIRWCGSRGSDSPSKNESSDSLEKWKWGVKNGLITLCDKTIFALKWQKVRVFSILHQLGGMQNEWGVVSPG